MSLRNSYNPDKSYELMAHIINDQMSPYDETAKADITEILRLCYVYSTNEGKGYELSAADLGQAIVDYLSDGYGAPDFHASSEEFWNPPKPTPNDPAIGTPEGGNAPHDPDDGLLIP
ncbi:hypothetical protein [Microbacterium sp. UBA3486]|uniref:hypothetical protein n=1 Tax=Microbacterium TaxID=33882 RepID=UPI0025DC4897|nr:MULTISPECIES: hypothetical protein [Microbacterium]